MSTKTEWIIYIILPTYNTNMLIQLKPSYLLVYFVLQQVNKIYQTMLSSLWNLII